MDVIINTLQAALSFPSCEFEAEMESIYLSTLVGFKSIINTTGTIDLFYISDITETSNQSYILATQKRLSTLHYIVI